MDVSIIETEKANKLNAAYHEKLAVADEYERIREKEKQVMAMESLFEETQKDMEAASIKIRQDISSAYEADAIATDAKVKVISEQLRLAKQRDSAAQVLLSRFVYMHVHFN